MSSIYMWNSYSWSEASMLPLKGCLEFRDSKEHTLKINDWDFLGVLVVKNLLSNAGDLGSISGLGIT